MVTLETITAFSNFLSVYNEDEEAEDFEQRHLIEYCEASCGRDGIGAYLEEFAETGGGSGASCAFAACPCTVRLACYCCVQAAPAMHARLHWTEAFRTYACLRQGEAVVHLCVPVDLRRVRHCARHLITTLAVQKLLL